MDYNAEANAEMSRANAAYEREHAVKAVECRKCGVECAWAQSKSGKWYLCYATFTRIPGKVIPDPRRTPHSKYCKGQKG